MLRIVFATALLAWAAVNPAKGDDFYISVPFSSLKLSGTIPVQSQPVTTFTFPGSRNFDLSLVPYVVIDGQGEAFILCPEPPNVWRQDQLSCQDGKLVAHIKVNDALQGELIVPNPSSKGMKRLSFSLPKQELNPDGAKDFHRAKEIYYRFLLERGLPGSAWFRHEYMSSAPGVTGNSDALRMMQNQGPLGGSTVDETYSLFSGGRAVSENLQLDRGLLLSKFSAETIDVSTLSGLTTPEFDWKPLVANIKPESDSLARAIPFDQYALFFPSFLDLTLFIDEAGKLGGEILSAIEPRSEDAAVLERYQSQICLPLNDIARSLGPTFTKSVALTGSDPYFRTGTDVSLLLESENPSVISTYVAAQQSAAKSSASDVESVNGSVEGVSYQGVVSKDRRVSSYLAVVEEIVIVTNSLLQLERTISVAKGKITRLSSLDEYRFFRDRYKRQGSAETALLVVPDAAIRKWGSAAWRIGASRRTRAAALLSELQANNLTPLVKGEVGNLTVKRSESVEPLGELSISTNGVRSSRFGTLEFLIPISELKVEKVSEEEKTAYERFRNTYSTYWRTYFDPIGAQVSLTKQAHGLDLTVMPLIAGTDYAFLRELARGEMLDEYSGDIHAGALLGFTAAIDSSANWMATPSGWSQAFLPGVQNPLGWIGKSFSIYLDDDPLWEKVQAEGNKGKFLEENYGSLPFGLFVEVKDTLKLASFLTAIKSFSEQSAPGLTQWETLKHKETPYVKIHQVATATVRPKIIWSIYYAATPDVFLLSLREGVLKRALDRLTNRSSDSSKSDRSLMLGSNLALEVTEKGIGLVGGLLSENYTTVVRDRCWANIPILNEWKRRFPDLDPVVVHQKVWKTRLFCPAGGDYTWNPTWKTMESTFFGHPGEIKSQAVMPSAIIGLKAGKFSLKFEHDGIRAKVLIEK